MGKLFEKIFEFLESRALSMSKKITMLVLIIMIVLLVDNHCGFSYYFVQSYKLDYITRLEDARVKYANDGAVSQELDRMMVNALNRWTVYNAVSDIFQKTFSTTSEAREQQLAKEIVKSHKDNVERKIVTQEDSHDFLSFLFPIKERSPLWHTVCSCFNLILFLFLCIFYLICSPFIHDDNKKNALLGMCVIIPILIGLIFLFQWLISFIPDINGRPRINYLIYVVFNISFFFIPMKKMKKS